MSAVPLRLAASQGQALFSEASRPARDPLVLFVLNGEQTGATVTLQPGQRYLVGDSLDNDVVIETGERDSQLLILFNDEGLVVRHLSGRVWVGETPLAEQQMQPLPSATPVTLGRACFAVGHSAATLRAVALPAVLTVANGTKESVVPLRPNPSRGAARVWRYAAMAAIVACAALGFAAYELWRAEQAKLARAANVARLAASIVEFSKDGRERELVVTLDAAKHWVSVTGYALSADSAAAAQAHAQTLDVPLRWHARNVSQIQAKLNERLGALGLPATSNYLGQGTFEIAIRSAQLPALRRGGLSLFRDASGLERLAIKINDVLWIATLTPVEISMSIPRSRPDQVEVQAPDVPYLDVFTGPLSINRLELDARARAVVTKSGERYFEGAKLPDGSELSEVARTHITLSKNGAMRKIEGIAP
ncbi:MAG: SctD/MshK family protein [Casimicrobium sp.]